MFGMLLATGLAAGRWIQLLVAIVLFAAGTWIRIRSEERLLRQAFGSGFEEYARKVPALIPGVYWACSIREARISPLAIPGPIGRAVGCGSNGKAWISCELQADQPAAQH